MEHKIYTQHWVELSKETRTHLMKVFGIVKTGIAEVRDTTLISDGVTNQDLEAITAVKMAEYTGSPITEAFSRLWELTNFKAKYELNPPMIMQTDTDGSIEVLSLPEKTLTRPFCDFCESKGVRHKMNCTNPNVRNGFLIKNNE